MRVRFVTDEADDADGLTPFKEDNEVCRKSGRKDIKWFYWIIVLKHREGLCLQRQDFLVKGTSADAEQGLPRFCLRQLRALTRALILLSCGRKIR